MMITMVVSVYNTGKYLPKAMENLLAQTYRDFEILIVDDGSTDGSAEECERQAEGHENVRVFHKANGGLSSARNFGIEHANGDRIIFPDPDDWVAPDYLERLVSIEQQYNADLAICGHYLCKKGKTEVWNPKARPMSIDAEKAMEMLILPDSFCGYAWNKLYRMDVIRDNNLRFDVELGVIQDLHFAVRYFAHCKTVAYDPAPLYYYSRDNGGVTLFRKTLGERELSGLTTYERIAEFAHGTHPKVEEAALAALAERSLRFIGIYNHLGMNEPEKLAMLRERFMQNKKYFFASRVYTFKHKCAALVAIYSPSAYYFLVRHFGHMRESRY